MVYRRRKSFRRRRFRRRFSSRRGYKRIRKTIRKTVINMAETHSANYSLSTIFSPITTTWLDTILFPSQGGQSTQVVGRRYEIIGFKLFGTLAGGQTNTALDDKYNIVRMMAGIFDGDSVAFTSTQRWPVLSQGLTTPVSLRNPVYPADGSTQPMRRKVKDKVVNLVPYGRDSTGYLPAIKNISFSHKFKKPIVVNYLNDGGTLRADKYLSIGMCSDSTGLPSPGFISGSLIWYWKDL